MPKHTVNFHELHCQKPHVLDLSKLDWNEAARNQPLISHKTFAFMCITAPKSLRPQTGNNEGYFRLNSLKSMFKTKNDSCSLNKSWSDVGTNPWGPFRPLTVTRATCRPNERTVGLYPGLAWLIDPFLELILPSFQTRPGGLRNFPLKNSRDSIIHVAIPAPCNYLTNPKHPCQWRRGRLSQWDVLLEYIFLFNTTNIGSTHLNPPNNIYE